MSIRTVDHLGNELLFRTKPKRIVSLVPSLSELVSAYEPDIELIGVTRFCEHPVKLRKEKTIIGGTKDLDIDKIIGLNADLILANKEENTKLDVTKLQDGQSVFVTDINDPQKAAAFIGEFETLVEIPESKKIHNKIKKALDLTIDKFKGTVAYVIWKDPLMLAGKNTYIDSWFSKIGLVNVVSSNRYPSVSVKELIALSPDYVFLSSEPYPFKERNRQEFKKQFPGSKIVLVDGRLFSWYGPAILEAPQYFSKLLDKVKGET